MLEVGIGSFRECINDWLSLLKIGTWLAVPQSTRNRHLDMLGNMMCHNMAFD